MCSFKKMLILFSFFLITSCTSKSDLGPAEISDNYFDQLEEWKSERMESLTNPTGWLRLAGMHFLEIGENTFGSGNNVDVQFPSGTIPEYAGLFTLQNGTVTMRTENGVEVKHEEEPVTEMVIFDGEEDALSLTHGSLEWVVIEREGLYAIRLYNKENEKVDAFEGFPRYETDTNWVLRARYHPAPEGTTIPIINVLGQQSDTQSPGTLEFMIDDEIYTLDALEGSTSMFIIVADLTNRTETYQAGRYMYVEYPEDGSDYTVIDFNKVYNPPCSYNLFTTCQLPPVQNRLDIEITAGELRPVGWDGL